MIAEAEEQKVQILQEKVEKMIRTREGSNKDKIDRIEREGNLLNDFLAPMGVNAQGNHGIDFHSNGVVKMITKGKDQDDGDSEFTMHPHALTQTGTLLGIPTAYIKKLAHGQNQWERDLAAHTLNQHNMNIDRRRMLIRSIGGEVRGVLSDKYRRLSTPIIYGEFFKKCREMGAVIIDAVVTDLKSYVEVIIPQVITVPTHNGNIYFVPGLQISNSDFGAASLQVKSFHINVVCLNGMTRNNILRSVHLGKRLQENIAWSEQTYLKDTETQASMVRDIVVQSLNVDAIRREAQVIQKAAHEEVEIDNVLQKLSPMGVLKDETESIRKVIMAARPEDGMIAGSNLWKVTQGITAVGRDLGGERGRELNDIAGQLLSDLKLD